MPQPSRPLDEYRRKRDFGRTPEPAGAPRESPSGRLYVMHKHAASHDHFDLRLEHRGVLLSWALPKGPSLVPGEKRLAVEVEDHPLEYGSFEGVIPKGEYGGGTVMLWDAGSWRATKHDDGHIDFVLDGVKLKGAWTLVRTRGSGKRAKPGKSWLLIKRSDRSANRLDPDDASVVSGRTMEQIARDRDRVWGHDGEVADAGDAAPPVANALAGATRAALPERIVPQLATLVDAAPDGDQWLHEIKFDGYRVLARLDRGRVRLFTRNGHDWTERFPAIAELAARLPAKQAVLDGEVVVPDDNGATSFRTLQEALGGGGRTDALAYVAFDLLYLDGHSLQAVPQLERKQALYDLLRAARLEPHGALRYSDHIVGHGAQFFAQACELGLEGIICKRADAPYRAGRGRQWLKVKCTAEEDFVIGGYTDPGGSRSGFGALLLGSFEAHGALVYAGKVGTGFSSRQLTALHRTLADIETGRSPFATTIAGARRAHWVTPTLVAAIEFTERTRDGRLRHPSFRGLRDDLDPHDVRRSKTLRIDDDADTPSMPPDTAKPRADTSRLAPGDAVVAGVRLSHSARVMFPEQGVTKRDLAQYYVDIEQWVMPQIANRPLTLVRCPEGRHKECFYQKHLATTLARQVPRVDFRESRGVKQYAFVRTIADLVSLVQAGVLEFHPFGSRVDDLEHPDLIVFDLDPSEDVPWSQVLQTTRDLRERIEALGLGALLRTTGGKGLHIVVPLQPKADWDTVKAFAQRIAELQAQQDPSRLTTNMSKAKRGGRIFIDYLRNARGSTAIASYSLRAREGAPVSVPMRWDELGPALRGNRYTIRNVRRRLAALKDDPWADFDRLRRPLDPALLRAVGLTR